MNYCRSSKTPKPAVQRRITRSTPTKRGERPIPNPLKYKDPGREPSRLEPTRIERSLLDGPRAIHSDWVAPTSDLERLRLRTAVHRSLSLDA